MTSIIISALIFVCLPMFLLIFLKTNAGVMFLAACAGLVLLDSLDPTVVTTAGAIIPGEGEAFIRLAVVLLSIIFAATMFRHAISNVQLPLHIVITLLMGVMLWLVLPSSTGVTFLLDNAKQSVWQSLNDFLTLIIASGFSLSLLALLLAKPAKHEKGKH